MTYAGAAAKRWDKPDGAGPVTEADLAVNDLLASRLRGARPDYGWFSEETDDTGDRLDRRTVFIVDPIDGTRSFIDGSDIWAHALAVVHDGAVTDAVIYLPRRDLMYTATLGGGAWCNGEAITPSANSDINGATVLGERRIEDAAFWPGGKPAFQRHYRPSLAYRMAIVAEGRFDAMLTLRETWEWDVAAGDLILREAGAICTDRAGGRLCFNSRSGTVNGVLAAGPGLYHPILTALSVA